MIALALLLAAPHTFAVVIGNNQPPADSGLQTLRYADDDALAMAEFLGWMQADVSLLTELDTDSQQRYPGAAAHARTPTLASLQAAIAHIAQTATPDDTVWFFFSGHGDVHAGEAQLLLADQGLTHDALFALLAQIPARYVHLFVDACHAEAVVQSRGAQVVEVDPARVALSPQRPSRVGVMVAASASQQAHEWSLYQRGVFTHELLSGLAGAADVNGDGAIEYSELQAFISAANRDVKDARARLQILAQPPRAYARVPLVSVPALRAAFARLEVTGHVVIEDDRGLRWLDAHQEAGAPLLVAVPPERDLFVSGERGETHFKLAAGEERWLRLEPISPQLSARGALAAALESGLFRSPFGPHYYAGFADSVGAAAVPLSAPGVTANAVSPHRPAKALWIAGGAAAGAAVVLGVLAGTSAADYNSTPWQKSATEAHTRYEAFLVSSVAVSAVALALGGAGAYFWLH